MSILITLHDPSGADAVEIFDPTDLNYDPQVNGCPISAGGSFGVGDDGSAGYFYMGSWGRGSPAILKLVDGVLFLQQEAEEELLTIRAPVRGLMLQAQNGQGRHPAEWPTRPKAMLEMQMGDKEPAHALAHTTGFIELRKKARWTA
jgi:hypothetical protein